MSDTVEMEQQLAFWQRRAERLRRDLVKTRKAEREAEKRASLAFAEARKTGVENRQLQVQLERLKDARGPIVKIPFCGTIS